MTATKDVLLKQFEVTYLLLKRALYAAEKWNLTFPAPDWDAKHKQLDQDYENAKAGISNM